MGRASEDRDGSAAGSLAAEPSITTPSRRIAILGFSDTVKDAPWTDPSWELWGMNGFWRVQQEYADIPEDRYSLWFDMHTLDYLKRYGIAANVPGQQEEWLAKPHPFPIVMIDDDPSLPSVVRFPLETVVARFGRDYFTSTVAYALTMAMIQPGVSEIGLWGVDLVHGTEWGDQRPCAEYWIGRAEAAGIKVTIHERSALLRQRGRYGFEDTNPLAKELRELLTQQEDILVKGIEAGKQKLDHTSKQMHTDDGALQAIRAIMDRLDIWSRGGRV